MAKTWIIKEPDNINKILSRLGAIERKRYDDLLAEFEKCEDPRKLGKLYIIKGKRVFAARLNKSYRIIYFVIRPDNTIIILAVGDHKETGLKE